jgi:UDP-N-acetylglucosamine 2-epimerase
VKVVSVVGNRPQFIKSGPVSAALRGAGIEEIGVHTGQHWDRDLSDVFYEELALPEPRYWLDLHTADAEAMRPQISAVLEQERPDWTLVYGDTNSTLAGAEAAGDATVPVAHVEAGLRSGDLSMPEEHNRIAVDAAAALLLCPDERSRETLLGERVPGRIDVVGDVMRDALDLFLPVATRNQPPQPAPYAVLTLHRAANTDPDQLRRIVSAVNEAGWTFLFPVHPRTRRVLDEHGIRPAQTVQTIAPLGYLEMLALVAGASRVVTDSGGLQKEAYWLGIPCVTLRPSTEWLDTVRVGANTLVDPGEPSGLGEALAAARFPADAPPLYGDGHAAERVAASLAAHG